MIPPEVSQQYDGFYYQNNDGKSVRVCEECWQIIPPYVDFPFGLVSPFSDGDHGGTFAKTRKTTVEVGNGAKDAIEHLRKCVCLPCYLEEFRRFYPDAPLPELSSDIKGAPIAIRLERESNYEFIPEPRAK